MKLPTGWDAIADLKINRPLWNTMLSIILHFHAFLVYAVHERLLSPSVLRLIDLPHWGKPETILEQGARLA